MNFGMLNTAVDFAKNLGGQGEKQQDGALVMSAPQDGFDKAINRINRLGRPFLLFAVIMFFGWAIADPVYFTLVMNALASTPEFVASAILMIIAVFGTGRVVRDFRGSTNASPPPKASEIKEELDKINERRFNNLEEEDDDLLEPASDPNESIEKWKNNRG